MTHVFYSVRTGINKHIKGLDLSQIKQVFLNVFKQLDSDGYFDEDFGSYCVDAGEIKGKVQNVELEILLKLRKENLWRIENCIADYSEDDLFDMIEFLYQHISKPIEGNYHSWNDCGMHWQTFNKSDGQSEFIIKMNEILALYEKPHEISKNGEILEKSEKGFEKLFEADIPTDDENIKSRINSAVVQYRRHGATIDNRRVAVRELADVLEYLKPKVSDILDRKDESDLFNIVNNFGIRHHNKQQKTDYDTALWLNWMFYYYLATIHVLLRKIDQTKRQK